MKNIPILCIIGMIIVTSCHKSKPATTTIVTGPSSISGLTSVRHRTTLDTNVFDVSSPYITWNFSGTNPILAMPDIDTFYFGYQKLFFNGSNATQLSYYNDYVYANDYESFTANITYTSTNQVDTITFNYPLPLMGSEKLVFQYSGNQITKVIVAHTSNTSDTFYWSTPDVYYYTYTGSNISKLILPDGTAITYLIDSRSNNFAGSISTFSLLEFLEESTSNLNDFLIDMPFYTNANITLDGGTLVITDPEGRIIQRIFNYGSPPDTTFYTY